ncbi:hypothetical protein BGX28_001286 [Mortierella sp. GBA30]|nr:hypothetical protein BGX28_001286 [Mortierella sp. GBA30]
MLYSTIVSIESAPENCIESTSRKIAKQVASAMPSTSPHDDGEYVYKMSSFQSQPPVSSPIKAGSLPEIALLIAKDLCKDDLASCSLVCRAWSHAYVPLLWRELSVRILSADPDRMHPVALLLKIGPLIKVLKILDDDLSDSDDYQTTTSGLIYDSPSVNNVVRLSAQGIQARSLAAIRNIIHRNKNTLRFLWFGFRHLKTRYCIPEQLFDFPSKALTLESLYLQRCRMSRHEFVSLLKACPSLKLLSFEGILILDNQASSSHTPSSNMIQSVDTDEDMGFQHQGIETFRMCSKLYLIMEYLPRVRTLEFYRFDRQLDTLEHDMFCESIRSHCLQLQELWAYGFECSMLPKVLDSMPRLVTFRGSSDMATVLSILGHSETLEEANLSDFTEKTFIPLKFLESCPRLRIFWSGHSSTTIAEVQVSLERGWACKELAELRLSIFKLSPMLIDAIMQDLKAEREPDAKALRTRTRVGKGINILSQNTPSQYPQRIQQQAAMGTLSAEQQAFQTQFSTFLRTKTQLRRLNFGTGWYCIPKAVKD